MTAAQQNRARRHTGTSRPVGPMSIAEVQALPAAVDLIAAGRAMGIGRNRAYELVKKGEFPLPVLVAGTGSRRKLRVAKVDICAALKLPLT
jgi:hypothetical protein